MPRMKLKTKSKKKNKINNIRPVIIEKETKPTDENSCLIPRSEICFNCGEKFWLKFSFSQHKYSLKNNLFCYTGKEEDRDRFFCSPCLRGIYFSDQRQEFLANFKNLSMRNRLTSYIARNII